MLFRFNHDLVMFPAKEQEAKRKSNGDIQTSVPLSKEVRDGLGISPDDQFLVLVATDDRSVIAQRGGFHGDSKVWTFETEFQEALQLEDGDQFDIHPALLDNITPIGEPADPAPQRKLPSAGNERYPLSGPDPTGGTWLFIERKRFKQKDNVSDGVEGRVHVRTRDTPYRQFLNWPDQGDIKVLAEHDGKSIEFEASLIGDDGEAFTFPIKQRQKLGLDPGDEVDIFIDTQSVVEAAQACNSTTKPPKPREMDQSQLIQELETEDDSMSVSTVTRDELQRVVLKQDKDTPGPWVRHYTTADPAGTGETVCGLVFDETGSGDPNKFIGDAPCAECALVGAPHLSEEHAYALLVTKTDADPGTESFSLDPETMVEILKAATSPAETLTGNAL